jgi:hypothetical protein
MGRIFLIAAVFYGFGHPGFDGHRPADLDRPLRHLHQTVDAAAIQLQRALIALDNNVRALPTLTARLRQLSDVLL